MIDAQTLSLLQDIVRRESRSLLQYVSESYPWTTPEEQEPLAKIRQVSEEEREGIAALTRLLARRRHTFPYLGSYPMDFTCINYVGLDYWLPLLVDYERRAIADLESDVPRVGDAEARAVVQSILDTKRRHLQTLEKLAAAHTAATATLR